MAMWYDVLQQLAGKTIEKVDNTEYNQFTMVTFTDGTYWLIVAERSNVAGASLMHKVDYRAKHG